MEETINSYYPSNNNKIINNKQFIEALYRNITTQLKRPMNITEKKYLQDTLRQDIPIKFRDRAPKDILEAYTRSLVNRFMKNSCTYDRIDTHELNKSQIGLDSEVLTSDFSKQAAQSFSNQVVNPNSQLSQTITGNIKQEYITLDSRYRSLDNDGTSYFRWNPVYDNSDIQGGFNINQKVRDVIAIKCFPIKMPYVSTADNDYGRITLLFQEFQSQAFIAHENMKFHFVFATDVEDRWIHLRVHNYNDGIFKFSTPITQLSSLTVSFGSPLQPVLFDLDRMTMYVSDYVTSNKITFTSLSGQGHNLETGDTVYISNFTTFSPASNASIISAVNTKYGNKITTIDNLSFYLDIDASSIYKQGGGQITVTNGSVSIVGIGSNFTSVFLAGDRIFVNNQYLVVSNVSSNNSMTTTTPYMGATGTYDYWIDNRINNLQTQMYFGSKRLILFFEITYIESVLTHT